MKIPKELKNLIIIIVILLAPLIGIILMWFWADWSKKIKLLVSSILLIPIALMMIYLFVAQPFKMSGISMTPTLTNGNYFLAEKLSFKSSSLKRGDVLVIKDPKEKDRDLVKRVVALPGETIKIAEGKVYINDQVLDEPYLQEANTRANTFLEEGAEFLVPEGRYIVLGDNRSNSVDSRQFGPISISDIVAKFWFTYY